MFNRHFLLRFLFISLTTYCSNLNNSWAFSLTPMSTELEPSGKGATTTFIVDNPTTEKIPVQLSVTHRNQKLDGTEETPDASNEFILYPPEQVILGPNEKRTIRLTYTGDPNLKEEKAYRIIAEQVPVDLKTQNKKQGAMIKMLLRYLGAVYVKPSGVSSKLVVTDLVAGPKNKKAATDKLLQLTIENQGTAHQVLKQVSLSLENSGTKIDFKQEDLKNLIGQNILAKSKRNFLIPWPTTISNINGVKIHFEGKD